MTLNDKICEAGVTTLAEYLCLPLSSGPIGDVYIADGIFISEEKSIAIMEYVSTISIKDDKPISVLATEDDIMIQISEAKEIKINGS